MSRIAIKPPAGKSAKRGAGVVNARKAQHTQRAAQAVSKRRQTKGGTDYEAWLASLSDGEAKVEHIIDMMAQGRWLTNVSDKALAQEWGVGPSYVRQLATEASHSIRRLVRETTDQKASLFARLLQTMDVIRAKALINGSPAALRVALDATCTYARYLGLEPIKRVEVHEPGDEFNGWSNEELDAFAMRKGRRALTRVSSREENHEFVKGTNGSGNGHDTNGSGSLH